MNKKFICLDIGNVLLHLNMQPFINKMSDKLNVSRNDASELLRRTQCLHDLGYTTMEKELRDWFSVKSEVIIEEMVDAWNQCATPDYDMLTMLTELTFTDNLQIALLSNMGLEHAANIKKLLSYGNLYDNAIKHLSCEIGARKPHFIYYQSFLLEHPEFKGCLYLDDLQENLDMGSKIGFKSTHFDLSKYTSDQKTQKISEIKSLILNG